MRNDNQDTKIQNTHLEAPKVHAGQTLAETLDPKMMDGLPQTGLGGRTQVQILKTTSLAEMYLLELTEASSHVGAGPVC